MLHNVTDFEVFGVFQYNSIVVLRQADVKLPIQLDNASRNGSAVVKERGHSSLIIDRGIGLVKSNQYINFKIR